MNASDVLPSPALRFTALSRDDLGRCAPSVFADHARPGVSSRYTFVSTAQVVDLLHGEGWEPVKAEQQRVRLPDRQGFQLHEIRFARRVDLDLGAFKVGECRPELILHNSHDATRAYRIDAGLYRLVCRNGLVVADADFAHVAIRHLDVAAEQFAAAAQAVAASVPHLLDAIARWQAVELTELAQHEFARRAAALRWMPAQPVTRLLGPASLLVPFRAGDDGRDLWTTFNVVQEQLLRGGDRYLGYTVQMGIRRHTTRPVTGLTQGRKLNKALWALAEEFSRN
jgi:hypothetical protein